jgi:hypothetical protein
MRIAVIVVAIVVVSSPSHASSSCMTQAEARKQFSTSHLYWHGPGHCWDATAPRRRLAQRAKSREPKQVERAARHERKPPRWTQENRWREAMSEMLPEGTARLQMPARTLAASEPSEAPSPGMNWLDRWVNVVPRAPPIVDKSEPADLSPAAARSVEPMVTPTRLILAFLAVLLTLAVIEILFRTTIPE